LKVKVKPEVVAGTERGGEDLFLVFSCYSFDTEPLELEVEEGQACSLSDDADSLDDEDYDEETGEPDPEKVTYTYCTDCYEIDWSGTLSDLRELAVKHGVHDESKWSWYGSCSEEPKKRFHVEFYVDGNAE
jgi:hypothetical protein